MKIREKLSLIYVLFATLVIVVFGLSIYFFSDTYREREFYDRLNERVNITEKIFLEAETLPRETLADIREKFLHTLPEETEEVISLENGWEAVKDTLKHYPDPFVAQLRENGYAEFDELRQGVGRKYRWGRGDYLVIVTAVDEYGITKLHYLKRILLVGLLIGILSIGAVSYTSTQRALAPLSHKIEKASRISASNLHLRLNVYNESDEIGQLAMTFNQMLERLERAFRMQKNFISNASHEIRNPLTTVMGEAELALERERSPEEYKEALSHILEEAGRLNNLVTQLLNLSQTDFDSTEIAQNEFRMDELLMDCISEVTREIPEAQVRLNFDSIPEDAEALVSLGNENLLRVALGNLIGNASKFSGNKPVEVRLGSGNRLVEVEVLDQGIGIPAEEMEMIFEPLYRASNARSFKGFGIGLALTRRIIELHGGTLSLESTPGEGTKAKVVLPVAINQKKNL